MTTLVDRACLAPSSASFPGHGEGAGLDLSALTPAGEAQLVHRFTNGTMDAFTAALASVGNCAHPIKLRGGSTTIDAVTGEVLAEYDSATAPLGVTHIPCGNRRASVCPACSRRYAADTWQMLRAGATGGKTVPDTITANPLVFATLTAPSFGAVHGARDHGPCRRASGVCPHGIPRGCTHRHTPDDPAIGSPVCAACYDYTTHILWQWWAPELWRRFTIALRRQLAHILGVSASRLGDVAAVQYAKVAEYQRRGAIHFHALIRLDGPKTNGAYTTAPAGITAKLLARAVRRAVASVTYTAPAADTDIPDTTLRFGRQTDVRIVRHGAAPTDPTTPLSPEAVAGYLAKYATKSSADSLDGGPAPHYTRLRAVATRLADAAAIRATQRAAALRAAGADVDPRTEQDPYERLTKWVDALGFRGHFSSKSRRYSITLGALRRARRRWQQLAAESQRTGIPLDTADLEARLLAEEDPCTTHTIGQWAFAGTGWTTDGDRTLALAAAARAREHDQWKATHQREHSGASAL